MSAGNIRVRWRLGMEELSRGWEWHVLVGSRNLRVK